MINYKTGDLLAVKSGIIVHGVNTLSVMGAGVALSIKKKYPGCFLEYKEYITEEVEAAVLEFEEDPDNIDNTYDVPESDMLLGDVHYYQVNDRLYIANAFTQDRLGFDEDGNPPADIGAIATCLANVADMARACSMEVHMPMIGCGLGGLSWDDVRVVAEYELRDVKATCWTL